MMGEGQNRQRGHESGIMKLIIASVVIVAGILLAGSAWLGQNAAKATEEAVRSVSLFYLNELAGRREQVLTSNLNTSIRNLYAALELLDEEDLSDMEHLQQMQSEIKQLYDLDKFAFVDTSGTIYTSQGIQTDIDTYSFDYLHLRGTDISVRTLENHVQKVIIAVPVKHIRFLDKEFASCFMEIDMEQMLEGVSLQTASNSTTFCNLYTDSGVSLTNVVLGGLAREDNLLDAMHNAQFDAGYTLEGMLHDFSEHRRGLVSFVYNGYHETLNYVPVEGTDWMLTYLIRESVISAQFSTVYDGIIRRSMLQLIMIAAVMLAMFGIVLSQTRRNAQLTLEKETAEAENRVREQELEHRLSIQEQLLEKEKLRVQQDEMITALASDYRSVYFVDLDTKEGVCYRADTREGALREGDHFRFYDRFTKYAEEFVAESYRKGFLDFINPATIKERLKNDSIITYRYLVIKDGEERYEMLRMAGVRQKSGQPDQQEQDFHTAGAGFSDVDSQTREEMSHSQALGDALAAAEEASKAKTAFLSSMSHEIRTPMNAIIGLDTLALNEKNMSEKTREYLEKIGDSARHLLALINDILDMSRIESGRLTVSHEEFSCSKLLEQINNMVSTQCQDKGLQYDCQIDGQIDDYYIGDAMKLKQILINILSNAVKFTPEGGAVSFTVTRTARFDRKSTLRFVIKDTGIGISSDYLPKIFDAFSQEDSSTTNKFGSTGLGLAITKSMVEMMNGRIDVESEKGNGTTFTVTITLTDSDRTGNDEEENLIRPQDLSALIVDDDQIACDHAKLVLENAGIEAETALSGARALEMVRLRCARRNPYNLILVDWKMPEMDGLETTRQLRAIAGKDDSAIIILTAYRWDDILEEAADAGVDSFIAKPLFASNVLDEYRRVNGKKKLARSGSVTKACLEGRRVLLAEDMMVNAEIIKEILAMRGIQTEHATNGREAVDMFADSPENYYDAILMDMRMPEMDGLQASAAIRSMDNRMDAGEVPIIALTANAFDEDVERSLQAGLNAHLSKPVEPDNLFETLESLIAMRQSEERKAVEIHSN